MDEALRYLRLYELWIYLFLGGLALWQLYRFLQAWQALRLAVFGLEREAAQLRLNSAAVWFVIYLFAGVTEFVLVSFVIPTIPAANPIPTPTLNLNATPTITLVVSTLGEATPQAETTPLPEATLEASGCISGTVALTNPVDGDQLSGVITLEGSASLPNLGFYKYEVARPGETIWLSISAFRDPVVNGPLGDWDTRTIPPGEYFLRLVVTDNDGNAQPPCVIRVWVVSPAPAP